MISATAHDLAMELAKAQAARDLSALEIALLAHVAHLEKAEDEQNEYIDRFKDIEAAAENAFSYHRLGKFEDEWDEWDAKEMVRRLDALGVALAS